MEYDRRKEEKLGYKLKQWAAIVGALTALGGGFFWLGGTKWISRVEAETCHAEMKAETQNNKEALIGMQKDIQYIRESVQEIKRAVVKR